MLTAQCRMENMASAVRWPEFKFWTLHFCDVTLGKLSSDRSRGSYRVGRAPADGGWGAERREGTTFRCFGPQLIQESPPSLTFS